MVLQKFRVGLVFANQNHTVTDGILEAMLTLMLPETEKEKDTYDGFSLSYPLVSTHVSHHPLRHPPKPEKFCSMLNTIGLR